MLQTLLDIKADVREIHSAIFGGVTMKMNRRMTPEERAASEARRLRHPDLMRRLEQMIERYRKINEERRAAGAE